MITCEEISEMEQNFAAIKGKTKVNVGGTVCLEGIIPFRPIVKYLKWQKYHNGHFIDINIHKPKYHGTRNYLPNPMLVINDIDLEDGVGYRIKFQRTPKAAYSNVHMINVLPKEDAETVIIEVHSNQRNGRYYVGEDVILKATIRNVSAILSMTWQKETLTGSCTINTSLPEYKELGKENDEYTLVMNDCNESKSGTYFLLAACTNNLEVSSNKVQIHVVKERPDVNFHPVAEALFDTNIKFEATIRSFMKRTSTIWRKGMTIIDITAPKYKGSSVSGDKPALCINNVNEEDKDVYRIDVNNDWGTTTHCSDRLIVIQRKPIVCLKVSEPSQTLAYGNTITLHAEIKSYPAFSHIQWTRINNENNEEKIDVSEKITIDNSSTKCSKLIIKDLEFNDNGNYIITVTNDLGSTEANFEIKVQASSLIFISGPVVVPPMSTIMFETRLKPEQNCLDAKWFIFKGNVKQEVDSNNSKYIMENHSDGSGIHKFHIQWADADDSAGYQLSLGNMRSNKIHTFVDDSGKFSSENQGNCLRYFALQAVCADAMRKAFDNLPDTFEEKINKFKERCGEKKNKQTLKGLLKCLNEKKPSSSKDLDMTLMYTIIRNTNYIDDPKKGWGKESEETDIEIGDDIEKLRHFRNRLSHENTLEMETQEFNKSTLSVIMAIQRLSNDDDKLMENICDVMDRVIAKGEKMDELIRELIIFQQETILCIKAEETQDPVPQEETVTTDLDAESQEDSIVTDDEMLPPQERDLDPEFQEETVLYDREITPLQELHAAMDNLNIAASLSTPFPRQREEFWIRKLGQEFNGEMQVSDREMKFHQSCDSSILIGYDGKSAFHQQPESGFCFMDRPMNLADKVHIRGIHQACKGLHLLIANIGLTNIDPATINGSEDKKQVIRGLLKPIYCLDSYGQNDNHWWEVFHLCISLRPNANLLICFNGTEEKAFDYPALSGCCPLWLVIELTGFEAIWISHI